MSKENQHPNPPTEEQIKEYEAKMMTFYKEALPFLELKAKHDMLNADIAEARIRMVEANHNFQQYMASQNKPVDEKSGTGKSPIIQPGATS